MPENLFQIVRALNCENARLDELPKPRPRMMTKNEGDQAAQMYAAGIALNEITKAVRRHWVTVRRALVARGIQIRPVGRRPL